MRRCRWHSSRTLSSSFAIWKCRERAAESGGLRSLGEEPNEIFSAANHYRITVTIRFFSHSTSITDKKLIRMALFQTFTSVRMYNISCRMACRRGHKSSHAQKRKRQGARFCKRDNLNSSRKKPHVVEMSEDCSVAKSLKTEDEIRVPVKSELSSGIWVVPPEDDEVMYQISRVSLRGGTTIPWKCHGCHDMADGSRAVFALGETPRRECTRRERDEWGHQLG